MISSVLGEYRNKFYTILVNEDINTKLSVVEIKHKCNLANIKDNESNEREGNEDLQTK